MRESLASPVTARDTASRSRLASKMKREMRSPVLVSWKSATSAAIMWRNMSTWVSAMMRWPTAFMSTAWP